MTFFDTTSNVISPRKIKHVLYSSLDSLSLSHSKCTQFGFFFLAHAQVQATTTAPPQYFSSIVDYQCFPKTYFPSIYPPNFLSETPPKWARYGYCMPFSIFSQISRACTGAAYNHSPPTIFLFNCGLPLLSKNIFSFNKPPQLFV